MSLIYGIIWGCSSLAAISAVAALAWSVRRGQLDDLAGAAHSIFDEPDGTPEPGPEETGA